MRIVSLDYCADQYVLALADRNQITALSPGAERDDSYFHARASGIRRIRTSLEDALALRPDLIVRDWGGPWDSNQTFARFGVPVLNVGGVTDFVQARETLVRAADVMGQSARGAALAQNLDWRLARLAARQNAAQPVFYMTAAGASAGPGVFMDAVIRAGGGRNVKHEPGWSVAPLERLVQTPPALIALGFFDTGRTAMASWSPSRHPALQRALAHAQTISMPAGAISCDAWYGIDASEQIARALGRGA